jgi:hypothetical protein
MPKIMLDEDILSEFSQLLWDIRFSINLEINKKYIDRNAVYEMTDQMVYAWDDIYNPAEISLSKALRILYGQYIKAKKDGDIKAADVHLKNYIDLKEKRIQG